METIKKETLYIGILIFSIFIFFPLLGFYSELKRENEVFHQYLKDIKAKNSFNIESLNNDIYDCANSIGFKNPEAFLGCVDIAISDYKDLLDRAHEYSIENLEDKLKD